MLNSRDSLLLDGWMGIRKLYLSGISPPHLAVAEVENGFFFFRFFYLFSFSFFFFFFLPPLGKKDERWEEQKMEELTKNQKTEKKIKSIQVNLKRR